MRLRSAALLWSLCVAPALAAQQGKLVRETEPNDGFATANLVLLGDTISGFIDRHSDRDYFALDLPVGKLQLVLVPEFCPGLAIFDRDQRPAIGGLNCYSEVRTINMTITTPGRYYLRLLHDDDRPDEVNDPPLAYKMRVAHYEPPPPGPANPMRLFTAEVGEVLAMTAAPNGEMLIADRSIDPSSGYELHHLWRVDANGHASLLATDFNPSGQIAVDAFGDLLIPSYDQGGVVWRYNLTTGVRSIFTGPPGSSVPYRGITIGADGDVWLAQFGGMTIYRFDAFGVRKGSVPVSVRVFGLTTSQSGELFFVVEAPGDVYKLVNNATPQRVIAAPADEWYSPQGLGAGSVALDQDGWLYIIQPGPGKLLLFNAQYQLVRDPLAQVLDSLRWKEQHLSSAGPAWMRDANGAMTSRLLVVRGPWLTEEAVGPNEVLETKPGSMGSPGADPGLHVDRSPLRAAALTATYNDTLRMLGGGTANWSIVEGHLPAGIVLGANGVLTGIPTTTGTSEFAVRGVNGTRAGFARLKIVVNEASPVQVTEGDIAAALMGGASLSADVVTYLDTHGNNNGRLDVGDLRAYLRAQGQLTGTRKATP